MKKVYLSLLVAVVIIAGLYIYKKSTDISPPDTGVEITSTSKNCIPPFSSLTLGVTTDEPAQCRISTAREKEFDKINIKEHEINPRWNYTLLKI